MATFNAELANKAMERRVTGLENMVDAAQKQSRASGDLSIAVAALQKQSAEQKTRIDNLEKLVKTLMETRGESKGVALDKLQQSLKDIEAQQRKDRDALDAKLRERSAVQSKAGIGDVAKQDVQAAVKEQMVKMQESIRGVAEAESKRRATEQERKTEAAVAEAKRQNELLVEKSIKEAARINQENAERVAKALIDAQLKVLTARLGALEGQLKK